jgi:hypothetical protein
MISSPTPIDQIFHSYFHKKLALGEVPKHSFTRLTSLCCAGCLYIRIHRREGNMRVLSNEEINRWTQMIKNCIEKENFLGCIYVLWGTDYAFQPVINANKLFESLPVELRFDLKSSRIAKASLSAQKRKSDLCEIRVTHLSPEKPTIDPSADEEVSTSGLLFSESISLSSRALRRKVS